LQSILSRWQFKSLTHRLLATCVAVAAVIYGASFVQMRQVLRESITSWISQIARARVDAAAARLNLRLDALALAAHQATPDRPAPPNLAGASAWMHQSLEGAQGWHRENDAPAEALKPAALAQLQHDCDGAERATAAPWSLVHRTPDEAAASGLPSTALLLCSRTANGGVVLELDMGWLAVELDKDLRFHDEVSGLDVGWPLIYDLAAGQWLLPPPDAPQWLPLLKTSASEPRLLRTTAAGLLAQATPLPGQLLIGLNLSAGALTDLIHRYVLMMLASMVRDMLLIVVTIAVVSRRTTRGLRSLMGQTELITAGDLDKELPRIPGNDEVGRLARSFSLMQTALRQQLDRLRQNTATQQKLESELAIARQIQQSMLPQLKRGRAAGACAVAAVLQPAREVGGDFYDCFAIGADRLCLVVGDVAGKGIPAALLMARTIALVRGLGPQHDSPAALLTAANRELCVNNDECMFVTLFCAMVERRTGSCRYASAGHDAPLLRRGSQVQALTLETAPAAGLDEAAHYPEQLLQLQPDDLLLLYSDGITEATDRAGTLFGPDRLAQAVQRSPCAHPAWVVRELQQALAQFVASAAQSDDITILALQYQPEPANPAERAPVTDHLMLNGLPTPADALRPCLRALLIAQGSAAALVDDAELVAEEVLTNVRQHGAVDSPAEICVLAEVDAGGITLDFEDTGQAFDPLSEIPPPDLDADDEQRSAGGFGFFLVRQLCHSLRYDRLDGRNHLQLRLQPGQPVPHLAGVAP
jgi:sigma-B regulation protein RsbU (phosphoserine phosphatase)